MAIKDAAEQLTAMAVKLAKPAINGEIELAAGSSGRMEELLWTYGYLPARTKLIEEGVAKDQVEAALAAAKALLNIVEPDDLVVLPPELLGKLRSDFAAEVANEPPPAQQRLDERVINSITEFRVEMYSNESQHAGRPHVKVYVKNGSISISLDDPPEMLTPTGGLVGAAAAVKVVAKNRSALLKIWIATRPDTQKLKRRHSEPEAAQQADAGRGVPLNAKR